MILRPYQDDFKYNIYEMWNSGIRNVLAVLPTGLGKTKTFCSITLDLAITDLVISAVLNQLRSDKKLNTAILVHRKELLQQISLTLAEEGIIHNIVAQPATIRGIIGAQRLTLGKQFYNANSTVSVVSVDTLCSKRGQTHYKKWAEQIEFWIIDEAAHVLKENKWGKAISMFVNAIRGLGVTATPKRLDKKGLGTEELGGKGLFGGMVVGPSTRFGIEEGFLAKYLPAIAVTDYQQYLTAASNGADFSHEAMAEASAKSQIVGDTLLNYRKFADNKQAIVFASDIASATKMEDKFNKAGIKAKLLTGETGDMERLNGLLNFRKKEIRVLINVDLFDEGLDVPGIDAVILARPTMSLSKYLQMCGRGLRPVYAPHFDLSTKDGRLEAQAAGSKPHAIIIDQVGNIKRHGLPDARRVWNLSSCANRREKILDLTVRCENPMCDLEIERHLTECPHCGTKVLKGSRGLGGGRIPPALVDGDLMLVDPDTLRELESMVNLEDPGEVGRRVSMVAGGKAGDIAAQNQRERIDTQNELKAKIAEWAGKLTDHHFYTDRQIYKEFFIKQGKTIAEAISEPRANMQKLIEELE